MIKDFETKYKVGSIGSNFTVAGTDGKFAINITKINDWHVTRDGIRDSKLTDIMIKAAGNRHWDDHRCVDDVANALRAQYESEKPKKFEFMTDSYKIYQTAFYSSNPYIAGSKHAIASEIANVLGPLGTFKVKVTIEEIK